MLTLVAERSSILIADGNEQWLLQAATGNDKLFLWHYARRKRRENPYGAMSDENRRNRWFNLNKIRRNCDVIFLTEICVKGRLTLRIIYLFIYFHLFIFLLFI